MAFNFRASFADMSQQEPLLVSWSLSAWSLSPWPLSLRLARSGSLNVELLDGWRNKKKGFEIQFVVLFVNCPLEV